jgi:type I restriction enzyme S subunit
LNENDIVFARTGGTVGKSFLIKQDVPSVVFASYLIRIVLTEQTDPHFIHYFFQSGDYWQQIQLGKTGLKTNVNAQILSKLMFPLPPLNEQKRIVSKIEELFSKIDSTKQSLEYTKLQLEQYRQSLLKSAFEGKLTEKWREETNPIINQSELQSWKDQRVEQYDEGCKLSRNTKKPKLSEFKILVSKDIPESWISTTIEGVASFVIDCPHSTPKFVVNGQYCIDTTCIKNSKINWNKIRSVSPKSFDERTLRMPLLENDIVFSREGTVGTSVLVPKDIDLCLGQRVMMFRFPKFFNAKFAELFLQSLIFKQQYLPLIAGSTVPHLNVGDVRKFNVLIPTIKEQEQIVSQIELGFSLIENTSQIVESTLQNLQTMKMSVLKQAFEGKLVPQDPNDEPASVLLEKIKSTKESKSAKQRRIKNVK